MPPREAETRGAEIGSVPSGAREIPKGFLEFYRQTRMRLSASSTPQTLGPLGAFPEFLEAPGAKWISLEDRFGTFGSMKSSDEDTRRDCMVTQLPPAARKLCLGEDPVRGMGGFLDAPPPLLREGCPATPSFLEEPAFPEGFFFCGRLLTKAGTCGELSMIPYLPLEIRKLRHREAKLLSGPTVVSKQPNISFLCPKSHYAR